jgi:hypothetical protein
MATLLVFISFGAFLLNSAAVPAFTGHITRLATKFVF